MNEYARLVCKAIATLYEEPYADVVRIYYVMFDRSYDKTIDYILKRTSYGIK